MLVRFKSDVGGFSMFGDVARTLLKMMGHSGTIPGAILPADIPEAIQKLEAALEKAPPYVARDGEKSGEDHDPEERRVSVSQRAFPLLELLKNAAANNCSVLWENG